MYVPFVVVQTTSSCELLFAGITGICYMGLFNVKSKIMWRVGLKTTLFTDNAIVSMFVVYVFFQYNSGVSSEIADFTCRSPSYIVCIAHMTVQATVSCELTFTNITFHNFLLFNITFSLEIKVF